MKLNRTFLTAAAFILCIAALNTTKAQTWYIGYPNATDVMATLSNDTLTISGSGNMQDFTTTTMPWYDDRTTIIALIISDSVTSIGNVAFFGCGALNSVTIPNSVTSIGNYAFRDCSGLISVIISDSVTNIGNAPFANCSGLTSINVAVNNIRYSSNDGILYTKLQDTLIQCPGGKTGIVIIPNSVTNLGYGAFAFCSGITSISVAVSNIRYSSNEGILYSKLQDTLIQYPAGRMGTAVIPNSVTSIGDFAFYSCYGLDSVTIPNSVTSIGNYAFYYCSGLTSITVHAITPPTLGGSAFNSVPTNIPIYIPCGTYSDYTIPTNWGGFTNFIDQTITSYTATISHGESYSDNNFTNLTDAGTYSHTLLNINGCDSIIELTLTVTGVGIAENTANNISIYPNPAQHTLYIEASSKVEQVSIYDISGRMLKQTLNHSTSIDVSNLASGIYLVKVKTAQGESMKKIVKL